MKSQSNRPESGAVFAKPGRLLLHTPDRKYTGVKTNPKNLKAAMMRETPKALFCQQARNRALINSF